MDKLDRAILNQLQRDAELTNAELAERVALSASQVSRRRTRLEQTGIISGYKAEIDTRKLGFGIDAFIRVTLTAHNSDTAEEFGRFIKSLPQVSSAYALTGDSDYLLHVRLRNLDELSELMNRSLLPHENVQYVRSEVALDRVVENAPVNLP